MKSITPENLARCLLVKKRVLLMLDYDGTLVPIAPTPQEAQPPPKLLKSLDKLSGLQQYIVAVLSGRTLEELIQLLPLPGLYLAGVHGAELRRPDGIVISLLEKRNLTEVFTQLTELVSKCIGSREGFLVENKQYALAIHYRQVEPTVAGQILGQFISASRCLIEQHHLELLQGKKIVEVRPEGLHKGKAVAWLREVYPDTFPVYIGDDTTDEDAFRFLRDGMSVLVSQCERPTWASFRIESVEQVQVLLELLYSSKTFFE